MNDFSQHQTSELEGFKVSVVFTLCVFFAKIVSSSLLQVRVCVGVGVGVGI